MSVWWHLRQWVYARPPVAAAGAVVLLLLVGFGGWASAQKFSGSDATQPAHTALSQVTLVKTVRVHGKQGRIIHHVVLRTRTLDRVTVKPEPVPIAKDVAHVTTQTVVKTRTVRQPINNTRTITQILTRQAPAENQTGPPPRRGRPTTVTVTRTQTVTQTVTVTVTTPKGH